MKMNKRIMTGILMALLTIGAYAQSGVMSPYSQFGLGALSDQSTGFSRGMNGVGLALHRGNVVNTLNPASYSAVDSLTMMFDLGLSGQITSFKEGNTRVNARGGNFDYFASSFRLMPQVGLAFGVLPVSKVDYYYSSTTFMGINYGNMENNFAGDGGLRKVFLGAGWRIVKPLSVGFNAAYLWGTIDHVSTNVTSSSVKSLMKLYTASVSNYTLDLGLQYTQMLTKKDELTVGATVGIGHKLGTDAKCSFITSDPVLVRSDTTSLVVSNALQLPMTYGLGAALNHDGRLFVGADFRLEKWGSVGYPVYNMDTNTFGVADNQLKDRYSLNVGADYVPNPMSRKLMDRIHYKAGAGFTTPYIKINGKDGPKEFSASVGFGIPLQNAYNNRSVLNISAQWSHASATGFVRENTFRISLGLTFNERWFMKWKID